MTVRPDPDVLKSALAEVDRVWREGGTATVSLPNPHTGAALTVTIDRNGAEEIIAWLCDRVAADLAAREQRGASLTDADIAWLRHYRESVPHTWVWVVSDGENVLIAENYDGLPIGLEHVLAIDPNECAEAVGWQVPRNARRGGFKGSVRLNVMPLERRVTVATLRFPPGGGLLAAWGVFERLNEARMLERLSPEDRRRYLGPYGVRLRGGREEVFNRLYQTTHERPADGAAEGQAWFYDDGHSEAEKQRRAEAALRSLGIANLKN